MQRLLNSDYIYLIPLTFATFVSLRSFRDDWPAPFRLFSIFLISTMATEWFAILWKWELYKGPFWNYSLSNIWIYNAFVTIRHLFLLFFFRGLLTSMHQKRVIVWSITPFLVLALINYIWGQTPFNINTFTIASANTITIFFCLAFFNQILKDKKMIALGASTEVWLVLGLFFYYSGTLPFFIFLDYLSKLQSTIVFSFFYINDALNIVMYSSFIIAYLCKPQFQK